MKIAGNAEFKKIEFVATLDLLAIESVATPAVLAILSLGTHRICLLFASVRTLAVLANLILRIHDWQK